MQDIIVVGAGTAVIVKMLHAINKHSPEWNLLGFVDDDENKWGTDFYGYPVLGGLEELKKSYSGTKVLCFIYGGDIWTRLSVLGRLDAMRVKYATLIYPGIDFEAVKIGHDCVVQGGCWLQTDVTLGNHSTVGLGSIVGHDVIIDDYAWVGPRVTILGRVHIMKGATLGAGSIIKSDLTVGEYSLVGMGSVVTSNVPNNVTVLGYPARVMARGEHWKRHPF